MPVRVSAVFSWLKGYAEGLAGAWATFYDDVRVGGPAFGDPGDEFTPGLFLKKGCTITSRGCPKKCGWCIVPTLSGPIRELSIQPGWIVQDDNLLACSERHIRAVFEMLQAQNRLIFFNGGLDKHFLRDWHAGLFASIPVGELWFACDVLGDLPALERATKILQGLQLDERHLRCYTMIGYDGESLADAERRVERVFELGFGPFTQLYQPPETKVYSLPWRELRRKWSRPAAYMGRKERQNGEIKTGMD